MGCGVTQVVYASEPGVAPRRAATLLDAYLTELESKLGPDCAPPRGTVHVHFCTLLSAALVPSVCAPPHLRAFCVVLSHRPARSPPGCPPHPYAAHLLAVSA